MPLAVASYQMREKVSDILRSKVRYLHAFCRFRGKEKRESEEVLEFAMIKRL